MFGLGATDTGGRLIPSDNLSFPRINWKCFCESNTEELDSFRWNPLQTHVTVWPIYQQSSSEVVTGLWSTVCEVHVPCIWLLFCALSGLHRILQISRTLNPQLYFTNLSILLLFVTVQCDLNVKLDQQSANLTRDCRDGFVRYSRLAKDRTGRSANYRYKQQTAVTRHIVLGWLREGVSLKRGHIPNWSRWSPENNLSPQFSAKAYSP